MHRTSETSFSHFCVITRNFWLAFDIVVCQLEYRCSNVNDTV